MKRIIACCVRLPGKRTKIVIDNFTAMHTAHRCHGLEPDIEVESPTNVELLQFFL
ncbi:hypothetical protein ACPW7J_12275 [Ihubacter sp. rT4E-8]|uniref:hypothetical protein n=1 Tax=Ihubacter sp. rT4E-8 TaxID=3242369 RepID=UPI003CEAA715